MSSWRLIVRARQVEQAKRFGRVGVLMGGSSAEREISMQSGTAVFAAMNRLAIDAVAIDVKECVVTTLLENKIDRVFNIIHGRGGEDGVLQGVLESMKIPYTGSGVMASALTMDKLRTKLCWQGYGLNTPKWFVLKNEADIDPCIECLGFPVIVKPALEGSSLGMSKANDKLELAQALAEATKYQCDVYAEAWVKGEEYTVAVLAGEALAVIRLETPNEFYDFEAKYRANTTQYHCPCGLSQQQEIELKKLAIEACKVVGVTGWGRVDLFIDEKENSQLIEVNTVPGMTDHSLVPMAAKNEGIEFDELVWRILETSINE
ncbi:MAG: D-alanine--D-alanine ligase [Methylococcales bacterium]|nr:D-alanine--D-alanine ligase [Methylococcales bacterium]